MQSVDHAGHLEKLVITGHRFFAGNLGARMPYGWAFQAPRPTHVAYTQQQHGRSEKSPVSSRAGKALRHSIYALSEYYLSVFDVHFVHFVQYRHPLAHVM